MRPPERRRSASIVAACLAICTATACATVVHRQLTADDDKTDRGVRYYGLSPYLIAYSNGKGGVVTEIRYLPDPSKKMSVRPDTTLANVETTLTFENGALTSSNDAGDATAVSKAVLSAAETLGTALIAGAALAPEPANERTVPAPYIYRIVVKHDHVELVGGNRPQPFRLTLLSQPPPRKGRDR